MDRSSWVGIAGGTAGALCAIHCAVVALLPGIIGGTGVFFLGDARLELALVAGALAMTGWAVFAGLRVHQHRGVLGMFGIAGALLVMGVATHDLLPSPIASSFSMLGGLMLVGTHVYNMTRKRACTSCTNGHT